MVNIKGVSDFCESFYQIIEPEVGIMGILSLQLAVDLRLASWE